MRISDWSSDVCSSDLGALGEDLYYTVGGYASTSPGIRDAQFNSERGFQLSGNLTYKFDRGKISAWTRQTDDVGQWYLPIALNAGLDLGTFSFLGNATRLRAIPVGAGGIDGACEFDLLLVEIEIGRASCRERVCQYV